MSWVKYNTRPISLYGFSTYFETWLCYFVNIWSLNTSLTSKHPVECHKYRLVFRKCLVLSKKKSLNNSGTYPLSTICSRRKTDQLCWLETVNEVAKPYFDAGRKCHNFDKKSSFWQEVGRRAWAHPRTSLCLGKSSAVKAVFASFYWIVSDIHIMLLHFQ